MDQADSNLQKEMFKELMRESYKRAARHLAKRQSQVLFSVTAPSVESVLRRLMQALLDNPHNLRVFLPVHFIHQFTTGTFSGSCVPDVGDCVNRISVSNTIHRWPLTQWLLANEQMTLLFVCK
jgi:hypothetical protein